MSTDNRKHRIVFYLLGGLSIILIFLIGYRTYLAQIDAKEMAGQAAAATKRLDITIASLKDSSEAIANMSAETVRIGNLNTGLEKQALKQSKTITYLSEQAIKTTTGGDSFGYIEAMKPWGSSSWLPLFKSKGKYPLYEVKALIVDFEKDSPIKKGGKRYASLQEAIDELTLKNINISIGDIGEKNETMSKVFNHPIPLSAGSEHSYNILFSARNGSWEESLKIVNANGKQVEAIQVRRRIGDKKLLFEQIDDGFPRNSKGEIDWYWYR